MPTRPHDQILWEHWMILRLCMQLLAGIFLMLQSRKFLTQFAFRTPWLEVWDQVQNWCFRPLLSLWSSNFLNQLLYDMTTRLKSWGLGPHMAQDIKSFQIKSPAVSLSYITVQSFQLLFHFHFQSMPNSLSGLIPTCCIIVAMISLAVIPTSKTYVLAF